MVGVEVGCRGFAGQSLHQAFSLLGIRGLRERRAKNKNIIEAAEKALRWLWIKALSQMAHFICTCGPTVAAICAYPLSP